MRTIIDHQLLRASAEKLAHASITNAFWWQQPSRRVRVPIDVDSDDFRIFLASPGGLTNHRRAIRDQVERLRSKVAGPRGVGLDLTGWEEVTPGFGRPQSIINPDVERCNLLIGLLGKRLGTPTGKAVSGFVEEYELVANRIRNGEDAQIWIYAQRLTTEDLEDPGEQLRAAEAFKRRVMTEALIKEFDTVDGLALDLYRDLNELVLEVENRRQDDYEGSRVPAARPSYRSAPRPSSEASEQQVRSLLESIAEDPFAPVDVAGADRLRLPRLLLWMSTLDSLYLTNETLGTHQVNRIYAARDGVNASHAERLHVLRTMCADRRHAPGWQLLSGNPQRITLSLLELAAADRLWPVRRGAFELVDAGQVRQLLAEPLKTGGFDWFFGHFMQRADEFGADARKAAAELSVRVGGEEAFAFFDALKDEEESRWGGKSAAARTLLAFDPNRGLGYASDAQVVLSDAALVAARQAARAANVQAIAEAATKGDPRLRILALRELANRDDAPLTLLVDWSGDESDDVAAAAFVSLCQRAPDAAEVPDLFAALSERDGLASDREIRVAYDRTQTTATLAEHVDWLAVVTSTTYEFLARERWSEWASRVRDDLDDHFAGFAQQSRDRLAARLGPGLMEALEEGGPPLATVDKAGKTKSISSDTVRDFREYVAGGEFNERQFATAALAGVACNGDECDADRVRRWLDSEHADIAEAAAVALGRVGGPEDADTLRRLALAQESVAILESALRVAGDPASVALEMVGSQVARLAMAAASFLAERIEPEADVLDPLLGSRHDDVRIIGLAWAARTMSDEDLASLLDRYIAQPLYFYNVVVWLDRILAAPHGYRQRWRDELQTSVAPAQEELPKLRESSLRARVREAGAARYRASSRR